jgi:DNA polymerase-3 subunit alpha
MLIDFGLIPDDYDMERRVYNFNKYIKKLKLDAYWYGLDEIAFNFYSQHFNIDNLVPAETESGFKVNQVVWDGIYQKEMDGARDWLKKNQAIVLARLNEQLFMETWDKYAKGSLSSWEMESLCFYYHDHELANVDMRKYGISNFFMLPKEPEVDYFFKRNGVDLPVYKTHKIIGTVISKNDNKSTVTLLTPAGVTTVKFTKEYYAKYKKQLSEKQEDGTKKVTEKGWFKRGTMLMITGFRRDDMFVAKTYKNTATHQIYKIELQNEGRDMALTHERADEEDE